MLVILAVVLLFMIFAGWVVIKILGLASGVRKIASIFSIFTQNNQYDKVNESDARAYNNQCPICTNNAENSVSANCKCILELYLHGGKRKLKCPICRVQINILLRNFVPETQTQEQLKIGICQYNKVHSTQSSFLQSLQQAKSLFPRVLKWAFSRQGIATLYQNGRLKTIIFSLLYMMSPFDILPEAILGPLGLLDDSLVGINIFRTLVNHFMDYVRNRDEAELRVFRQRQEQAPLRQPQQTQNNLITNLLREILS